MEIRDSVMSKIEETLRTELTIRMRYEMEMWQAHEYSTDRLEHHVDMIVRRVLELLPTPTKQEEK